MVTFAQAQERAEEWVNGDVPAYQHREVRVREFELGFVLWAEDRESGARSDGGQQRLVIARDSGEATLWPGLPVGEVIRRYEEEYGVQEEAAAAPEPPQRIDLNQTSFLLSPPEWLQEAADKLGIPDRRSPESGAVASGSGAAASDAPAGAVAGAGAPSAGADWSAPAAASGATGPNASLAGGTSSAAGSAWPAAGPSGGDASRGGRCGPAPVAATTSRRNPTVCPPRRPGPLRGRTPAPPDRTTPPCRCRPRCSRRRSPGPTTTPRRPRGRGCADRADVGRQPVAADRGRPGAEPAAWGAFRYERG